MSKIQNKSFKSKNLLNLDFCTQKSKSRNMIDLSSSKKISNIFLDFSRQFKLQYLQGDFGWFCSLNALRSISKFKIIDYKIFHMTRLLSKLSHQHEILTSWIYFHLRLITRQFFVDDWLDNYFVWQIFNAKK